jgi:hypothetical protein
MLHRLTRLHKDRALRFERTVTSHMLVHSLVTMCTLHPHEHLASAWKLVREDVQDIRSTLLTSKTHCEVPNFCGSLREAKVPVSTVRLSIKIISPAHEDARSVLEQEHPLQSRHAPR